MKPKPIRLYFRVAMMLLMLLTTMTAWATDPVTKTYAFSTRSIQSTGVLKMTDPDDNTSKTVITAGSNNKFSNYGSDLQIGAGGQFTIYPNINGNLSMELGGMAIMLIRSGCEMKITYIPSAAVLLEREKPRTQGTHTSTLHVRRLSKGMKKTVKPVLMSKEEFFTNVINYPIYQCESGKTM